MEQKPDRDQSRSDHDVGRYIVFGAGLGTIVFAITRNAVWIGIGAAVGIFLAGVLSAIAQASGDD